MPESDEPGNNIKVRKPAPYAPTVYADVTPTEVINKAEPNQSYQHTRTCRKQPLECK